MELSWEALAGIGIALVMLGAAVYKRVYTQHRGTRTAEPNPLHSERPPVNRPMPG
jgi:hypothetical protein